MGRLSKKDIEELREFFSLGCENSGTEEVVNDMVTEILEEMGTDTPYADEIVLNDGKDFAVLDDFVRMFWERTVEKICNVLESQGR